MNRTVRVIALLGGLFLSASFAQAQGLMDRLIDRAKTSAEQALSRQADKTINQTLNKLDECLTTDRECIKRAKDQGKEVTIVNAPQVSDSVKCMATDPACLKQAKAQGKKVEIIDETDLDVVRCSVSDADCLKRAKATGKKVEIVDSPVPDGGTLTLTGAPANLNIGEAFTPDPQFTRIVRNAAPFIVGWQEGFTSPNHLETLNLTANPANDLQEVSLVIGDRGAAGILFCRSSVNVPSINPCLGLTVNRSAGTTTFVNTVLVRDTGPIQSITLNGTLNFTPF